MLDITFKEIKNICKYAKLNKRYDVLTCKHINYLKDDMWGKSKYNVCDSECCPLINKISK